MFVSSDLVGLYPAIDKSKSNELLEEDPCQQRCVQQEIFPQSVCY